MTKQEYLDLLVKTSRDGGFPSAARGELPGKVTCLYRSPEGRRCGVGLLIPDDCYDEEMEAKSSDQLFDSFTHPAFAAVMAKVIPDGMTKRDLQNVQEAHDDLVCSDMLDGKLDWGHADFVKRLLRVPCFKGMAPTAA